jgi:hypothetical protein
MYSVIGFSGDMSDLLILNSKSTLIPLTAYTCNIGLYTLLTWKCHVMGLGAFKLRCE